MNALSTFIVALGIGALGLSSFADTVTMKDGTVREGTILYRSPTEIRIRVNEDGMQATISLPPAEVANVRKGPVVAKPPATRAATRPVSTRPIATTSRPAAVAASQPTGPSPLPPTHGFVVELVASLLNAGPTDPRRLPKDIRDQWNNAVALDAAGKRANELDVLRSLESTFHSFPGGMERLNGLSMHERQVPFGTWMANVHWDVLADNYRNGMFDLQDVRDVERPVLIGLIKEKTVAALEPLKTYFPPIDPKTNRPMIFRPAQLQAINVDNALDTRDKAMLAHALLLGQIKLEPQLSTADRQLLQSELSNVTHIINRTSDFESAARAAQQKAEREKKIADEKAKAQTHP